MKSAYEIALEKLEKEHGPTKTLTDAQRAHIADIEKRYEAKIAELDLSYDARMSSAKTAEELAAMREELASRRGALEADRDREKDTVWDED